MVDQFVNLLFLICLGAGTTLFYTLSVIEKGSRSLMLLPNDPLVSEEQIRKTTVMLHHVVPFFPPFQGAVMLGTAAGLVRNTLVSGWLSMEMISLLIWMSIMLSIVVFRRIGTSVAFLKAELVKEDPVLLRTELSRVIGSHHLALVAYFVATVIEVTKVFF